MSLSVPSSLQTVSRFSDVSYSDLQLLYANGCFQATIHQKFAPVEIKAHFQGLTHLQSYLSGMDLLQQKTFLSSNQFRYLTNQNDPTDRIIQLHLKLVGGGCFDCFPFFKKTTVVIPLNKNYSPKESSSEEAIANNATMDGRSLPIRNTTISRSMQTNIFTTGRRSSRQTINHTREEMELPNMVEATVKTSPVKELAKRIRTILKSETNFLESSEYLILQMKARDQLNNFDLSPETIEEIKLLVEIGDVTITENILTTSLKKLKEIHLPKQDLIQLINFTLQHAIIDVLKPELVSELSSEIQKTLLNLLQIEANDPAKLGEILFLSGDIFDTLGDLNRLNKEKLNKELESELTSLQSSSVFPLAFRAAYTVNAMQHIPFKEVEKEKPILKEPCLSTVYLKNNRSLAEGKKAPLKSLISGINKYEAALKKLDAPIDRMNWYKLIRIIHLLFNLNGFTKIEELLNRYVKDTKNPYFIALLLELLMDSVKNSDEKIGCLNLIASIFNNDIRWGKDERVMSSALSKLRYFADNKEIEEETRQEAHRLILGLNIETPKQQILANRNNLNSLNIESGNENETSQDNTESLTNQIIINAILRSKSKFVRRGQSNSGRQSISIVPGEQLKEDLFK